MSTFPLLSSEVQCSEPEAEARCEAAHPALLALRAQNNPLCNTGNAPQQHWRLDLFAFCEDNDAVHIISKKMLRHFWVKHPDAERPLRRWFRTVTAAEWES